ncbi:MAG: FtsX-like permease family protein [Gammaproteobacteria bacterium]|nr:FtsX-like permease family protein [Gammaproteobacteria bacterium]
MIANKNYFTGEEDYAMQYGLSNWQQIKSRIEEDKRVKVVIPRIQLSGLISNGEKTAIFMAQAVDPEGETSVRERSVDKGKWLSSTQDRNEDAQVLLGKDLAKSMKADIGTSLTLMSTTSESALNGIDVKVRGIISTGIPEMDKRLLIITIPAAQTLIDSQKVSSLHVYLNHTDDTDIVASKLKAEFPDNALKKWDELAYYYVGVVNLYNRLFGVLGLIIVIIVFFSISNTMSMVVRERTREIGTLAAMGTYPYEILRNFVLEALVIGVIGSILGMMFSGAVIIFLDNAEIMMPPPPGMNVGYPLLIYFSGKLFLVTTIVLILISALSSLFAARKGVKQSIVEALAHV